MGTIHTAAPVKLFIGIIFSGDCDIVNTISRLEKKYGEVTLESKTWNFSHTNYYEKEMGENLCKKFIAFKELMYPEDLPDVKIFTNEIEDTIRKKSKQNVRVVNLDPGYLDLAKVVLASTKDYAHRIYIGRGIYAEIEMFFQKKKYCFHSWTYPDYKSEEYIAFFLQVRQIYKNQIQL